TPVALAGRVFFGPGSDDGAAPAPGPADELAALVRTVLGLPDGDPVAGRRLVDLGMSSLQAVTLQYLVLERFDQELLVVDLLGDRTMAQLADLLTDPVVAARVS
ncbi:MAG: acyl carrier protein, partial [Frankiaceae bacterium]|nr:acyl carrier protein [Frankiaceae bacterium]